MAGVIIVIIPVEYSCQTIIAYVVAFEAKGALIIERCHHLAVGIGHIRGLGLIVPYFSRTRKITCEAVAVNLIRGFSAPKGIEGDAKQYL